MKCNPLLIAFSLVPALVVATTPRPASADEPTRDTVATIKAKLENEKAVLVDVREVNETNQGYVAGAVRVPLSDLQRAFAVPAGKKEITAKLPQKKVLYCYCRSGGRARMAADALQEWGYDARFLKLGFDDLVAEGFAPATPER